MTPLAEAGLRSLLFGGNVYIETNSNVPTVRVANPSVASDLYMLHPSSIDGDAMGTVYLNDQPTDGKIPLPANARFTY